ncbi:MAG: hypothetical protein AB1644_00505 [Candidatus Zixiibacteriota bacterium]
MATDMPIPVSPKKTPKAVLWTIIVVIVAAIVGLSLYVYTKGNENDNSNATLNANSNVNTVVNSDTNANSGSNVNAATNDNANVSSNLNRNQASSNTNSALNSNSSVNTVDWRTYTDKDYGFTFKFPKDWKLSTYPNKTISVAPPQFQEPIPFIKAMPGDFSQVASWIDKNWLFAPEGTLVSSNETIAFGEFNGNIYKLNTENYAAIANAGSYLIAVNLGVLEDKVPFADYHVMYQSIIESFTQ